MLKVQTEQSICQNVCQFPFLPISCAATKFCRIDSFLLWPNSRNEEMMGGGAFGATAAGLF